MWDEDQERQSARNQMRVMLIMALLMLLWFQFFMKPPVEPPVDPAAGAAPVVESRPDTDSLRVADEDNSSTVELPPVAETDDSKTDEVSISDSDLVLTFTKVGGRLKRAEILLGDNGKDSIQIVPEQIDGSDTDAVYPLGLRFSDDAILDELDARRWESALDASAMAVEFTLDVPGLAVFHKRFSLGERPHVVTAKVTVEGRGEKQLFGLDQTPAYTLNWGPSLNTRDAAAGVKPSVTWRVPVKGEPVVEVLPVKSLPEENGVAADKWVPTAEWLGYKSKYFLVAFKPEFEGAKGWARGTETQFRFGMAAPQFQVADGESASHEFSVYVGPMELPSLKAAWPTLSTAYLFFEWPDVMDWFAKKLLGLMIWFHDHTIPNYGVSIILLTIVVRTVVFPLTIKSMRSMKKMQALGPEMEDLREKYKDDQQVLGKKMMEMYRERGVNPLGGCFPMLLQMPVFIALYTMLRKAFELRGAPFLWADDLSQPDCLVGFPFMANLPLVGNSLTCLNLFPLLMGVAIFISMKTQPSAAIQNPQQKMMMNIMPMMMVVFCYPLAAGLSLYILTSTVLGIAQNAALRVTPAPEKPELVKPDNTKKKRKQHFYAKAQERKRQMKKEQDRNKKKPSDRATRAGD